MSAEELFAAIESLDEKTLKIVYRAIAAELESPVDEDVSVPEMLCAFLGVARTARKAFRQTAPKTPTSVARFDLKRLPRSGQKCQCGRAAEFDCTIEFADSTELDDDMSKLCGICAAIEVLAETDFDLIAIEKRGEMITQSQCLS